MEHIRLKIFLRTDIWRRITDEGFREASHITRHLTISWDRNSLMNLVVSRAIQNEAIQQFYSAGPPEVLGSVENQTRFFYQLAPQQVDVGPNKSETFDWMLNRTKDGSNQTAPRELIHLLNSLREVQIRRWEVGEAGGEGSELFARAAFKEALVEVSRARLEQTLYAEYPKLKPRLESIRGEKTLHTPSTLAAIWKCSDAEALDVAQQLVEVGFFEKRGSKEAPEFWVPFLYREALDLVQGSAE